MRNFGVPSPAGISQEAKTASTVGGKAFVQQILSRNVVGQGAGGTTVSDTDDLYGMEETSFFDQYKWPILGGTAVLLATGAYFFLRK